MFNLEEQDTDGQWVNTLVIPAKTFNSFIGAARDMADRRNSAELDPGRDYSQAGIVLVRNESGTAQAHCEVLGIGGTIVKPSVVSIRRGGLLASARRVQARKAPRPYRLPVTKW